MAARGSAPGRPISPTLGGTIDPDMEGGGNERGAQLSSHPADVHRPPPGRSWLRFPDPAVLDRAVRDLPPAVRTAQPALTLLPTSNHQRGGTHSAGTPGAPAHASAPGCPETPGV